MDMSTVDLTGLPRTGIGSEVGLWASTSRSAMSQL